MQIRKFRAASTRDALAQVRRELGEHALILDSRETSNLMDRLRYGRRGRYEVTAALPGPEVPEPSTGRFERTLAREVRTETPPEPTPTPASPPAKVDTGALDRRIAVLQDRLEQYAATASLRGLPVDSGALLAVYHDLLRAGLDADLALGLVQQVRLDLDRRELDDRDRIGVAMTRILDRAIATTPMPDRASDKRRIVALVGPTGVGKTTTLAKLASRAVHEHRERVGIVCADGHRVGARAQLSTYAELLGVPMTVAHDHQTLRTVLRGMNDCTLVFVDTAGNGQHDRPRLQELAKLLGKATHFEIVLAVAATSRAEDLAEAGRGFGELGPRSVIFTKLDETASFGAMVTELVRCRLPLAAVTVGQGVPDDICEVAPGAICRLLLDRRRYLNRVSRPRRRSNSPSGPPLRERRVKHA